MSSMHDDELALLWRQSVSADPDPEEIARLAGRASMKRFDRAIHWRNLGEYAAGVVLFVFLGRLILTGDGADRLWSVVAFIVVAFVLGYLWWQHCDLKPLDPSSDARAYQAAMLARIDKQIRLLGSYRYWYLMPLSIPMFWGILETLSDAPVSSQLWQLAVLGALFAGAAWLNENWGVRRLREERAKVESLYEQ
jgi:hypothetical protein